MSVVQIVAAVRDFILADRQPLEINKIDKAAHRAADDFGQVTITFAV